MQMCMRRTRKIFKVLKTVSFLLIAVLLFSSGYAQQKIQAEALVPGAASLYVKSSPVNKFVKSLKFMADNLLDDQQKADLYNGIKEFNDKSGLDILNPASLTGAGIDVNRPFSIAYLNKDLKGVEKMLVILPILNDKTFPPKFVEIIKKNSGDKHQDIYPAITQHKGQSVYQVQRDIFGAALDGWFIVAPTAETINAVIDLKGGAGSSLALDQYYIDYLRSSTNNLDVNAFMKREFLDMLAGSIGGGNRKPIDGNHNGGGDKLNEGGEIEGDTPPDDGGNSFNLRKNYMGAFGDKPELVMAQYGEGVPPQASIFSMVDYVSASVGLKGNRVVVNAGSKFNNTNPLMEMILNLFQTGTADRSIYIDKSKSFTFISFDFSHLEKLCGQMMPGCAEYANMKAQINTALGIDFSADFLPNYSGAINAIVTEMGQGAAMGKYVIYLPMKNQEKTAALVEKMTAKIVKDLGPQNLAGKTSIGGQRGFWVLYQNQKFFCVSDARGIYIGTTADIITAAMKSDLLSKQKGNLLVSKMGSKVFFLTYLTREAYAVPMMMMQGQTPAGASASVEKLTNRIGDIYITGERAGSSLSLDFEIEILKPAK